MGGIGRGSMELRFGLDQQVVMVDAVLALGWRQSGRCHDILHQALKFGVTRYHAVNRSVRGIAPGFFP
jgi:hypothetical protein